MQDDKIKIKNILLILILILMTACGGKNHTPSLNKITFNFDDFQNSDEFFSILDVTEDYVYYYVIYQKSGVINDEGEYLKKNENVTIYKRDKEGKDSIVQENLGDVNIASLLVIEDDIYLVSFEEIDDQYLPIEYKITKNYNEVLLEGKLDSTLAIPSLHLFEDKVYSPIENITFNENTYVVTKKLYEFTKDKLIFEIDENTIKDLSEINTLPNWSYGPTIVRSENNIVFSLSKNNQEKEYMDSTIYIYDGNEMEKIELADTYMTSVFEFNDKIFFLKEEKEKELFSSVLSVTALNDDTVKELNLEVQSITVLNEKDNIITFEYTGIKGDQGFATLDTQTLDINIIEDELFEGNSIFFKSPSGIYRTNAIYIEDRGTYYDIVEKIY